MHNPVIKIRKQKMVAFAENWISFVMLILLLIYSKARSQINLNLPSICQRRRYAHTRRQNRHATTHVRSMISHFFVSATIFEASQATISSFVSDMDCAGRVCTYTIPWMHMQKTKDRISCIIENSKGLISIIQAEFTIIGFLGNEYHAETNNRYVQSFLQLNTSKR
ncbi:hypothetical protein OCU04_008575 [Sclerotinia nivalis]|uniref:Uncharacterized protein n=1 Tax=Sclerotinia nivalis TaxID=352851 RepID=A0A9X0DIY6_9HELO|nr:hypothetical protein OCU04_008575 [Sclerotinia nivalis]